ncbi:DUF4263 domain-containing protein [Ensifer sp. ENS04]|uniref:Shedu anti-phage system protein SduA domain-containing protein n=1 Tax=Ensifer sp. ENS04 TaxID=2769281 RepID=UPI001781A470|nr:Shedu anti-phage system protein SduA domain-containing protein [Ensifer sp. ENS04]MBD9544520.1 DUF4263 domain-containing protein [Ensifer sp. ENS04]
MPPDFDNFEPTFIKNFRNLLTSAPAKGRQKEQEVQDYIEEHTLLFLPQFKTHKGIYGQRIVSKFKLGTEKVSDFTYVSIDSDTTNIVFVELESPLKTIFTNAADKAALNAKFTAAVQQVQGWRILIEKNRAEVIKRLSPLLPSFSNPIQFKYALIYGRSDEKSYENRREVFSDLKRNSGILLNTYDNLIDAFKDDQTKELNVMAHSGEGYRYKHLHLNPQNDFAQLLPDKLHLTKKQIAALRRDGYEMDEWLKGKYLKFNSKYATEESVLKLAPPNIRAQRSG